MFITIDTSKVYVEDSICGMEVILGSVDVENL